MTGIFYYISKTETNTYENDKMLEITKKINHRGTHKNSFYKDKTSFGKFFLNKGQNTSNIKIKNNGFLIIDGYLDDERILATNPSITQNDLLNIDEGYHRLGIDFFKSLIGEFSILYKNKEEVIAIRDPIGFNPLYIIDEKDFLLITSELKICSEYQGSPIALEPGNVFIYKNHQATFKRYYKFGAFADDLTRMKQKLYITLESAVKSSINTKGKVSALLSGGIDSVVICALAQKSIPNLDVYTIATENSPDLKHAKKTVEMYPKINHHIIKITIKDMLPIVEEVIYNLETFDAALIRSAIPMFFLCSKIGKNTDVLLTGEGGDELFGGYEYLKDLSTEQFNQELKKMLKIEHSTGLQRVDRIPYSFGIEARAPWFNKELVELSFDLPSDVKLYQEKNGKILEKWIIRETFKDIIPESVYKRKKAKFSKGVGTQFYLRDHFNRVISDKDFNNEKEIFSGVFLKNKEELHYWRIFDSIFSPSEEFVKNLPRTSVFII